MNNLLSENLIDNGGMVDAEKLSDESKLLPSATGCQKIRETQSW